MASEHKHIVWDGINEETGQEGVRKEEKCNCEIGKDHY